MTKVTIFYFLSYFLSCLHSYILSFFLSFFHSFILSILFSFFLIFFLSYFLSFFLSFFFLSLLIPTFVCVLLLLLLSMEFFVHLLFYNLQLLLGSECENRPKQNYFNIWQSHIMHSVFSIHAFRPFWTIAYLVFKWLVTNLSCNVMHYRTFTYL